MALVLKNVEARVRAAVAHHWKSPTAQSARQQTGDRDLAALTLLESACGLGAFLIPAAERLLDADARGPSARGAPWGDRCLRRRSRQRGGTRQKVAEALVRRGVRAARPGRSTVHEAWFEGDAPWVLSSPEHLRVLRHLRGALPAARS